MKIKAVKSPDTSGSVLLVTLVIAGILGLTLAGYLTMVSSQSRNVARSQHWNQALVIAESGLEDALQMVNKFAGSPQLTNWVSTYSGDNWSKSGNVYSRKGYMDSAKTAYYEVYVTNLNTTFNHEVMVRSTGYISLPSGWAGTTTLKRSVLVRAQIDTLFNVAMAALGAIDLKGNGVASDSFDSADPNYSTNGLYDPLKRKAGGDIATNNTLTNSNFTVGNANVAGKIITGPYGTYSIGPNGSVGDLPWVDAGTKGVKPGWAANDMNVVFKDVILPNTTWLPTGLAGLGTGGSGTVLVNGAPKFFDHVFTSNLIQDYVVTDNGSIYVGTNVTVRLKITASSFGPSSIYVAGTGNTAGKMMGYLTGTSATLDTAHQTQSGRAENMAFMGLPSLKDLKYNGNGDFTGVIYAPQADFHLAGGGSSEWDFIGSSVTKVIQMNGKYHFHYDENLRKVGPNNGYIATTWREF